MKQFFSVISFFVLISISAQTTLTKDTSFSFEFPDEGEDIYFTISSLQVAPDNSIYSIAARINGASRHIVLMKSNADGSIDQLFGISASPFSDGYIFLPLSATNYPPGPSERTYFMIQSSGKVILVKQESNGIDSKVYRYNQNGDLDTSFGNNGILSGTLDLEGKEKPLLLLEDDSFLEIQDNQLIKYNSNGQIDVAYGTNGSMSFAENPDTKIIGVRGNYVYGSDYAGTFSYFNYTNPTENQIVNYSEMGNISPSLLNLDENGSFSGLYTSESVIISSEMQSSVMFVLKPNLELDTDFYGNGTTYFVKSLAYGLHNFKTNGQYFVDLAGKLHSIDQSGLPRTINNEKSLYLTENGYQDIFFKGKDNYFFYTNTSPGEDSSIKKYLISSESPAPTFTVWDGASWSNGDPTATNAAVIAGNFNTSTDIETPGLKVLSSGSFNISSGTNVTVYGDVINDDGEFTIHDGANLVQTDDDAVAIGDNYTVYKYSQPMKRLDYTLWASPVTGQDVQSFSPETLPNRIYYYGENGWENTSDFYQGGGILIRAPNNWNSTVPTPFLGQFKGVINSGFYYGFKNLNRYSSIGNPYPSNLDADLFLQANPSALTLYFWTNPVSGSTGNNYATYTRMGGVASGNSPIVPNGIISVGQGFVVDYITSPPSADFSFNNSMRTTENTTFFKGNQTDKHRFWLNLNSAQNENLSQTLVGYTNGATNEIDNQIDGKMFGNEDSALYSIISEEKFSIQGRALPFEKSDVVKLGFKAVEAGKFTISLSNFDGLFAEGDVKIYLKDNELNTIHDLMDSDYSFETIPGEFKTRFEVVYETEEVMGTEDLTANSVQIYTQNDNIIVNSKSEKILSVELFDLQGRKIHSKNEINANNYQIKSNSIGVLVVRVQTQNGKIINQKIIVK